MNTTLQERLEYPVELTDVATAVADRSRLPWTEPERLLRVWISDLLSADEDERISHRLRDGLGRYDPLGRLCKLACELVPAPRYVAGADGVLYTEHGYRLVGSRLVYTAELPPEFRRFVGLSFQDVGDLVFINDHRGYSYRATASWIERNILPRRGRGIARAARGRER